MFLTPLVKHFGWTRTVAASLTMMIALTGALAGPITGRLLDSLAAQKVMAAGVAITAFALLAAGRANSFGAMAAAHIMMGVGTAASTMIPVSLVTSNWFGARRGVALGIAMSGMSLGASAMTCVCQLSDCRGRLAHGLYHSGNSTAGGGHSDSAADGADPARRAHDRGRFAADGSG